MREPYARFVLALALVWGQAAAAGDEPLALAASIVPVQSFVERVGGERVAVTVMVGPDAHPATYEPTPRQLAAIGGSRLFFRVGVPFEQAWLERLKTANPRMAVVDLRERIQLRAMHDHAHHGPQDRAREPGAASGQPDPHVWTDPRRVIAMASHVRDCLIALDPDGAAVYRANFREFRDELEALDRELRGYFEGIENRRFLVYHPAWGYFAEAYGLEQVAVEVEGKQPRARSLSRVIDSAREAGIRVVFVQNQFARRSAQRVADAIGARVVTVDPLAADYVADMRRVGRQFAEAMAP